MNGMRVETDTIDLPAFWASLLVNGDESGFADSAELARARQCRADLRNQDWEIIGTDGDGEPRFTRNYRLYDPGAECTAGEVLKYVILRREAR